MSEALIPRTPQQLTAAPASVERREFVTFFIDEQLFGIPVLQVQDILVPGKISPVPLAPAEVLGSINLRGRIVTVIDVRVRLDLAPRADGKAGKFGVTVELEHELYTLLVDRVGDVVGLSSELFVKNPGTLAAAWQTFSDGVYRLDDSLMVILNIERLLNVDREPA